MRCHLARVTHPGQAGSGSQSLNADRVQSFPSLESRWTAEILGGQLQATSVKWVVSLLWLEGSLQWKKRAEGTVP